MSRTFSVTMTVRSSKTRAAIGSITEVVEADSAQAAEDKVAAEAKKLGFSVTPLVTVEQ